MKSTLLFCLGALAVAPALRATTPDLAIVAAMKLPDAANYTWTSTIDDDARTYAIDGQTDRATDLSLVTMPMVASIRRRAGTGTSNSGNLSTAVFHGDEQFAVQIDSDWKTAREIADAAAEDRPYPRGGYPGGWGGSRHSRRGMMGGSSGGIPSGDGESGDTRRPLAYSNLQKTLSRPHEEVGIIVAGASDLKAEDGDIVSGTLSDTAAKLLLVHPGQKEITPLKASGTFRLWVKDGALVKYEVKLEGTLAVMANGDRHEVTVHQTALTEIKNVDTTKFDVPDEAKKKLGISVSPANAAAPAKAPSAE